MTYQFHVGQLVVCIYDNYSTSGLAEWCDVFPVAGQIYTVKSIAVCPDTFSHVTGVGLRLEELNNFTDRFCYSAWRFKPVVITEVAEEEMVAVA